LSLYIYGCASQYKPQGFGGGFSETQLGENIFRVAFRGNGFTSRERASDLNLLRSAEISRQYGFNYFIIVESDQYTKKSTYTSPSTSHTTGSATAVGNYAYGSATTTTYGGQTYRISKPRSVNTIVCFKDKPENSGLVFEASFIISSLKRKYKIK
jgi:hypothetical protein